MRLLIAEDDKKLGLFLSTGMEADGYRVRLALDGGAAVEAFREELPDLIILGLDMHIRDGEHVLEEIRSMDVDLPVMVLTKSHEMDTRERYLDRGADDLMTKPFSLHELRGRCRALLRRKLGARLQLCTGDLELDRLDHFVRREGQSIVLTDTEFYLLEHLMLNSGRCVPRVELLASVPRQEPVQTTNILDVYIDQLRQKLYDPPPGRLIRKERETGFLIPAASESAFRPSPVHITTPVEKLESRIERLGIPKARQEELQAIMNEALAQDGGESTMEGKNEGKKTHEQKEKPADASTII
jgi:DNA-binding response OmpR family regulator